MKKNRFLLLFFAQALQAGIVIDNRSSNPFIIKSITYEQTDGLRKTPFIETTAITVAPNSRLHLPIERSEPITLLSALYANKIYTINVSPALQGTILITPDNRVDLIGGASFEEKSNIQRGLNMIRYL